MFEAIIFDFDGLLMDTESTMIASWQAEWARHGLELDLADFWPGHGGDVTEFRYARLAARVGPGFDLTASRAWRIAYRDGLHETLDLRPGMLSWLGAARSLDLRLAIASSSPIEWVREHLSRVGALSLFDVLATGDEVSGHKPDPGVYLPGAGTAGRVGLGCGGGRGHAARSGGGAGRRTGGGGDSESLYRAGGAGGG